jgi:hypothetical protein
LKTLKDLFFKSKLIPLRMSAASADFPHA